MNKLKSFDFNEELFDFWQNKGIKLFSQNLICTYNVIVRAFDKSNIYTV